MRNQINAKNWSIGALCVVGTLCLGGCDIEQTKEGRLPDIDVDVSAGQMPAYDIETADVNLGTKEVEVEVPDVDVTMEKKTITLPDVDVDMPGDK